MVGNEEAESESVNVRNRDDTSKQSKGEKVSIDDIIVKLCKLKESKDVVNALDP